MSRIVRLCIGISVVWLASCSRLSAIPVSPTRSPLPAPGLESSTSPLATRAWPQARPSQPADADAAVRAAISDAASRLKVAPEMVQVVSVSATDWSDTSLGCPQPGMFYAQVIVQGYKIMLTAGGAQIEYHADQKGRVVTCK